MSIDIAKFRAVLFDLDDTLNDRSASWMVYVRLLADPKNGLLRRCKLDDVHGAILAADENGYRPRKEMFGELRMSLPWKRRPSVDQLEQHWRQHFWRGMVTREGAVDLLLTLRKAGLRLGIVTNGRPDSQNAKIEAMSLRPLVDVVVVSETVGIKKPDAGIFDLALKALEVSAAETLFVGDNPKLDIWGPAQLGMRTAWLHTGRAYPANIPRADYDFRRFEEFRAPLIPGIPG